MLHRLSFGVGLLLASAQAINIEQDDDCWLKQMKTKGLGLPLFQQDTQPGMEPDIQTGADIEIEPGMEVGTVDPNQPGSHLGYGEEDLYSDYDEGEDDYDSTFETEGQETYNFYGDINVVIRGNQNDITATSIQPQVAEKIIEAVKEIVQVFGEQQMSEEKEPDMDLLEDQDQESRTDILGEAIALRQDGLLSSCQQEDQSWVSLSSGMILAQVDKEQSGEMTVYDMMRQISLENCPFLKTLTRKQMIKFNEIHKTNLELPPASTYRHKGLGHGPALLSLSDRLLQVTTENCPFLASLSEGQGDDWRTIHKDKMAGH